MEGFENKINYQNKIEDEDNALLSADEQIEINNLRRKQTEEEFTSEEKSRFMELQEKEDRQRKENGRPYNQNQDESIEKTSFTADEKIELNSLRKKQIEEDFTSEERSRFLKLQEKEEQSKVV